MPPQLLRSCGHNNWKTAKKIILFKLNKWAKAKRTILFYMSNRECWSSFKMINAPKMPSQNSDTVKNLKFGTPQTIAIIVLKIEKFDVTLH